MLPWLPAFAAHLAARGFATYAPDGLAGGSWPVFLEHLPPAPDELVVITGEAGPVADYGYEPRARLFLRGAPHDPTSPRERAEAIAEHLHTGLVGGVVLPGGWWLALAPATGSVISRGVDDLGRHAHTTTHTLHLERL